MGFGRDYSYDDSTQETRKQPPPSPSPTVVVMAQIVLDFIDLMESHGWVKNIQGFKRSKAILVADFVGIPTASVESLLVVRKQKAEADGS